MNIQAETTNALAQANILLKAGNLIESKKIYSQLAEREENAVALHMLSRFALNERDHSTAEKFIERAIAVDSENPILFYDYAILKIELEDYETALEKLQVARKSDPLQPAILLYEGEIGRAHV